MTWKNDRRHVRLRRKVRTLERNLADVRRDLDDLTRQTRNIGETAAFHDNLPWAIPTWASHFVTRVSVAMDESRPTYWRVCLPDGRWDYIEVNERGVVWGLSDYGDGVRYQTFGQSVTAWLKAPHVRPSDEGMLADVRPDHKRATLPADHWQVVVE